MFCGVGWGLRIGGRDDGGGWVWVHAVGFREGGCGIGECLGRWLMCGVRH